MTMQRELGLGVAACGDQRADDPARGDDGDGRRALGQAQPRR